MERRYLDLADTIYAANFFISYYHSFDDAPALMRAQKVEDLKLKGLWDTSPLLASGSKLISIDPTTWGFNVYVVRPGSSRQRNRPAYLDLLDLTSSHINLPGFACLDYVVCLDLDHQGVRFHQCLPNDDEVILGFVRLDSGVLNNRCICDEIGISRMSTEQVNSFFLNGKVVVPTQPFGSLLRGGKLLALMAMSNEFRQVFIDEFPRFPNKCLFYLTSLYGTSKDKSQYSQMDRYLTYIGNTTGQFPLRMKDPHRERLLQFFHRRGFWRHRFVPESRTNQADRIHTEIVSFIGDSLRHHSRNKVVSELRRKFNHVVDQWKSGLTETKRTYISNYGYQNWKQVITGQESVLTLDPLVHSEYSIENLSAYWKTKVWEQKSWGMRKVLREFDHIDFTPQYLNDLLRSEDFVQVR